MARLKKLLVFTLAGWSGFYVMAVELLSGRILAPSFGNSIYVWGGIITVFMLALSVGYLIGGHLSVHNPSLRKLGLLLISASITTLPVILVGEPVLDWIFNNIHDPRYGSLMASSALLFIPCVLSGAISPYAIRLLSTEKNVSGKSAGKLYFISTFGSAAGTISTSFYLVLLFEINSIFIGMMLISAALGLLAVSLQGSENE